MNVFHFFKIKFIFVVLSFNEFQPKASFISNQFNNQNQKQSFSLLEQENPDPDCSNIQTIRMESRYISISCAASSFFGTCATTDFVRSSSSHPEHYFLPMLENWSIKLKMEQNVKILILTEIDFKNTWGFEWKKKSAALHSYVKVAMNNANVRKIRTLHIFLL